MKPHYPLASALLLGGGLPTLAHADFIADSKASVEMRNFYFNRDFRQSGARDKAEEWAQGFLLRMESGYTEGTVGFGIDALGMLGVRNSTPVTAPLAAACSRPTAPAARRMSIPSSA